MIISCCLYYLPTMLLTNHRFSFVFILSLSHATRQLYTFKFVFIYISTIFYHFIISFVLFIPDWSTSNHQSVHRQLSVSSDSKLLDDDIREETRVIMRPKKPPRPKSEVFLNKHDVNPRRKRFSAFGVRLLNDLI